MSIYDAFQNKGDSSPTYSKEEYAQKKKAEREAAYDMIESAASKIKTDGKALENYLKVQGNFDRYSVANAMLVSEQMPEATLLKDAKGWRDARIYPNQGANKITILEPGKEYTRDDGTIGTSFNTKGVYDISQTSARIRTEDMEQKPMRQLVGALIKASPVAFQLLDNLDAPAFYDQAQEVIFVKKDLPERDLFLSLTKEIAAAIYHVKHQEDRADSEFKSYAVAYMVGHKVGVDVSDFSFDELPEEFSTLDSKELRDELNTMRDVLGEIHKDMYKSLEQEKNTRSREEER